MYFDLTDDQKALRDTLLAFFERRFGAAQGVEATADLALDRELWAAISELGLGGALAAEDKGGLGMGLLTAVVVAEVLGRYAAPAPVIPNIIAAWLLAEVGSATQRERWLPPLMAGEAIAAFALSESAGALPENWTLKPSDCGVKLAVERGTEADLFLVGLAGGRIGVVPSGASGVTATPVDTLDRTRPLAEVSFRGAVIEPLAADSGTVRRMVDALLITYAADALGAAAAVQDRAVAYAKERRQYGRLIGSFQALKHQLADMSVELEPARPLCWYAAHSWDIGREDSNRIAALVKAHLGEVSVHVARSAIEAFGGIGYTWEFPAHLFLKRAMTDRSVLGAPALHRERAARLAGWSSAGTHGAGSTAQTASVSIAAE